MLYIVNFHSLEVFKNSLVYARKKNVWGIQSDLASQFADSSPKGMSAPILTLLKVCNTHKAF